jgi:parallel beta-helix repeat protein
MDRRKTVNITVPLRPALLVTCAAIGAFVLSAASASAAGPKTLWAAPAGSGVACTASSPCALEDAVANANPGDTVRAKPGTYQGGVLIDVQIDLRGVGHPTLDAASSPTGVGIAITFGGSGSTVSGFTVEHAKFEGILAVQTAHVTIDHNVVVDNNTGVVAQSEGECAPQGPIPGDCGEGIHLLSVSHSVVEHNLVSGNAGGILLTDEFGETADNVIQHNVAVDNPWDCGITLASHTSYGVHDNVVQDNVSDRNGVQGEGGGILIAGGGEDTAAYDNVIRHNEASGNDLAGVVIHQHFPSNLSGNVIEGNHLSNDNVGGDEDFLVSDEQTTGILVASGYPFPGPTLPPLTDTVIRNNQISHVEVGIWTLNVDPLTTTVAHNHFGPDVTTAVSDH